MSRWWGLASGRVAAVVVGHSCLRVVPVVWEIQGAHTDEPIGAVRGLCLRCGSQLLLSLAGQTPALNLCEDILSCTRSRTNSRLTPGRRSNSTGILFHLGAHVVVQVIRFLLRECSVQSKNFIGFR